MNNESHEDNLKSDSFVSAFKDILAEHFRNHRSLLTSKNLEEVAIKGYHTGSIAPFGYQAVEVDVESFGRTIIRKQLVIHTDESAVVKILFDLAMKLINQDKFSYASLARLLNEMDLHRRRSTWTTKNVKSTLRNPLYFGVKLYGAKRSEKNAHKKPLKVKCPAIVTEDTFDFINRYITRSKH